MLTRARVLVVSISLRTGLDMNPQDHWLACKQCAAEVVISGLMSQQSSKKIKLL